MPPKQKLDAKQLSRLAEDIMAAKDNLPTIARFYGVSLSYVYKFKADLERDKKEQAKGLEGATDSALDELSPYEVEGVEAALEMGDSPLAIAAYYEVPLTTIESIGRAYDALTDAQKNEKEKQTAIREKANPTITQREVFRNDESPFMIRAFLEKLEQRVKSFYPTADQRQLGFLDTLSKYKAMSDFHLQTQSFMVLQGLITVLERDESEFSKISDYLIG